jgi:hypothetical protein
MSEMSEMSEARQNAGGRDYRLGALRCDECGRQAALFSAGWRAYGQNERYTDELPELAFHCPDCSTPEFGAT